MFYDGSNIMHGVRRAQRGARNAVAKVKGAVRNAGTKVAIVAAGALPLAARADTDPFTTAMTAATTNVGTYAAALVTLGAVAVAFMIGLKYVKKIVKAS